MKKFMAALLAATLALSLAACGGGKNVFNVSKDIYEKVNAAYDIVEIISSDIQEAWRMGIYEDDDILTAWVRWPANSI